ncbi:MAG TPA: hypothetical protein VEG60_14455, partial [Candidatus Binatia bacterium]|nr:hypothetical protein [Candidatus Binatia bacterium]
MFISNVTSTEIFLWVGDPDCLSAYCAIQKELRKHVLKWLGSSEALGPRREGNLGEYIAFQVASKHGLNGPGYQVFLENAKAPLSNISTNGVDLTYIYLDPGGDRTKDLLYLQEVKTTKDPKLTYGDRLVDDYKKLFSLDLEFSLANRIAKAKNVLELERRKTRDVLERVEALCGISPGSCIQVRLLPTLVHERSGSDPEKRLVAVRAEIKALG